MKRREFIALVGSGVAGWPLAARAQQPAMPIIGFLSNALPDLYAYRLRMFHQGLAEGGYVEGQNVEIDYRWAEGRNDRLPELAAQLVQRRVAVIAAAGGTPSALAAKAATTTIPIVFALAVDPVKSGLVASLRLPGGNLTGVVNLNEEIGPKRLEVLHEVLPMVTDFAVLVDQTIPAVSVPFARDLQAAAGALGLRVHILQARSESDFEGVFANLAQLRTGALIIGPSTLFNVHSGQLAALTLRHAVPAIYQYHRFVAAGGLLSYGSDETEYYHLFGAFVAKFSKETSRPTCRCSRLPRSS